MDWSSFSIGNAAGFVKGPGLPFDDLIRAPDVTDITVGSITLEARDGNAGTVYWHDHVTGTSVNALGMPNPGKAHFAEVVNGLWSRVHNAKKRLRLSIAGFQPHEYGELFETFGAYVDVIELNLGCPNIWGDDGQKPIAAFDTHVMQSILSGVRMKMPINSPRIALKLSPYSDPNVLTAVAKLIKKAGFIHEVVTCNTFPNGLAFQNGARALDVGYGGVGGTALRNIALGQVAQFSKLLEGTSINIIGVGGISHGADILAMREAGASGIQVGTVFGERGARIFSEMLREVASLTE